MVPPYFGILVVSIVAALASIRKKSNQISKVLNATHCNLCVLHENERYVHEKFVPLTIHIWNYKICKVHTPFFVINYIVHAWEHHITICTSLRNLLFRSFYLFDSLYDHFQMTTKCALITQFKRFLSFQFQYEMHWDNRINHLWNKLIWFCFLPEE